MEPVTKGTRIVLQYDVEVIGWGVEPSLARETDEDDGEEEGDP